MIGLLIKKQLKPTLLLVAILCVILFVSNSVESRFSHRYITYQTEYMSGFDLSDPDRFFESLETDSAEAFKVVNAIRYYEDYDKEVITDEVLDPALIAAGLASYADYDMVVWRSEMLAMAGKYSDTVADDESMLSQLLRRLENQNSFEENLQNNIEIMRRGIRRNDGNNNKYEAVLSELGKVKTDFYVTETIYTDELIGYMESDLFILVFIVLSVFGVFSSTAQNKIFNAVLVSKKGVYRFALCQISATLITSLLGILLYYTGIVIVFSGGNIGAVAWELPIQALVGYENIAYSFSVLEYFLMMVLVKTVFCIFIVSITLLISVLSKNTVISAILGSALCSTFIIPLSVLATSENVTYIGLLIGGAKFLFTDIPCFGIGEQVIPYHTVFVLGVCVISLLVMFITVAVSKTAVKRWVK